MGGWHPNQWAEHRHPTLAESLDTAVPDRPVLLYERFTGPAVTNSMGKAFFDAADAATPVHPDIKKISVSANGAIAAAGFAGGGPSASALFLLRRMQTFEDKKRSTLDAMRYSASVGLDHESGSGVVSHAEARFILPRFCPISGSVLACTMRGSSFTARAGPSVRLQTNFPWQKTRTTPRFPGVERAALRESISVLRRRYDADRAFDLASGRRPRQRRGAWRDAQRLVGQAGWRNENAVQNLAGLTQVVESWEGVNREFDITKLRWVVHHVPEVNADLLTRLKSLGCGVAMGAFRWVTSSDPKVVAGPPFRTIADHGIQVGIHGDGVHIAPLNPWLHIYYATTGINSFGDQVNPGQHLTRAEALRLFTRNNSWFLRMEEKIGSLETGKLADLAVLTATISRCSDAEIKEAFVPCYRSWTAKLSTMRESCNATDNSFAPAHLLQSGVLFADEMLDILIILVTDVFQELRVGKQLERIRNRPRLRISLGIVDCDPLKVHMPQIATMVSLGNM